MNLLARLGQARIAAEIRFVLGGALAGAAAGLVPGLLSDQAPRLAGGDPVVGLIVNTARGVGIGWWSGLVWSVVLAVHARNMTPPAPVAALSRAAWMAAAAVVLGTLTAHLMDAGVSRGVIGGVVGGTIAARLVLASARRASAL